MNMMLVSNKWFTEGATDVDFIRANERIAPHSSRHCPISSADILTKFRERANNLGISLANEQGALLKPVAKNGEVVGGNRYIYVAEVVDDSHKDYALSVGFRNFGDTTLAFSGMCGTSIFVCQNGCCSSIVKDSRMMHTKGNVAKGFLDERIDNIFSRFLGDGEKIHAQIAEMKATRLTNEILGAFMRKAIGEWGVNRKGESVFVPNPYIGAKNLTRILEDLENPAYNDRNDGSVFRLHNACTKVATHNISNPNTGAMASRYLNNLIMGLINPSFSPLGDVVDVESSEELD